jgi:antitoxin component YwqK of YwqJK toxin-antitoxin module
MSASARAIAAALCLAAAAGAWADAPDRDAWRADTRGVLPRLPAPPTIDGTVGADEWAKALACDGALYPISMNLFPRSVQWRMGWDARGLYVACRTRRLKGEDPKRDARDSDLKALRADDAFELIVYRPDNRASLHAAVNPDGLAAVHVRGKGTTAHGVVAKASLTDAHLDYEVHVPFAALAAEPRPNDRWRILPVRHLRTGTNVEAPMPYNRGGWIGGHDRSPVFALGEGRCTVQLRGPQASLYAGRPVARLHVGNPSDAPRNVTARLRIARAGRTLGAASRKLTLPPGELLPVALICQPDPPIDPNAEREYRYALDVAAADGTELFHTHFTWNPAENRGWLGDSLPGRKRAAQRVLTVDPRKAVPFQFRRFMRAYEDLPEGHVLQIAAVRNVVPGKGYVVDSVQHITPVNPSGRKDGLQTFYRLGYLLEHSITWRDGVKHGPEKFYASGRNRKGRGFRYVQKIVPWKNGRVQGVQRVFHATGAVLAEVRYADGIPTGTAKRYDSEGRLVRITPFEKGHKHGTMKAFYPRRPRRVVPMRGGVIHGQVKAYDWAGRLVRKVPYREGLRHGIEEFRPDPAYPLVWEQRYWYEDEKVSEDRWYELTGRPRPKAKPQPGEGGR